MSGNQPTTPASKFSDFQGILALIVIVGAFVVAGVAIYLQPTNVTSVLASILPLASVVVGFYFGKSTQQQASQQ